MLLGGREEEEEVDQLDCKVVRIAIVEKGGLNLRDSEGDQALGEPNWKEGTFPRFCVRVFLLYPKVSLSFPLISFFLNFPPPRSPSHSSHRRRSYTSHSKLRSKTP
jgi:hypothetical protein